MLLFLKTPVAPSCRHVPEEGGRQRFASTFALGVSLLFARHMATEDCGTEEGHAHFSPICISLRAPDAQDERSELRVLRLNVVFLNQK